MTLIPESLKSILKRHDGGSAGAGTVIGAVAGGVGRLIDDLITRNKK